MKQSKCLLFFYLLFVSTAFAQKLEVLYAEIKPIADSTKYVPVLPASSNYDTLAKWIWKYDNGKALISQTEDSPYELKTYLVNKETNSLDKFTRYNMAKNDIYYNDYEKNSLFYYFVIYP